MCRLSRYQGRAAVRLFSLPSGARFAEHSQNLCKLQSKSYFIGVVMQREEFIPIAVWYTGGKARATMVRPPDADSPVSWKKDLETIKNCGFNTVRCWVDWATAEPQPGEYHFETLDLLMDLAE